MAKRFGLPKSERLKSRKRIDSLFAEGKGFAVFPIRVVYRFFPEGGQSGWQMGVSASKRSFKKAVDRTRIKRLLREAYRLQKEELQQALTESGKGGAVFFLYTGKTLPSFEEVKQAMTKCLNKLSLMASREKNNL